MDPPRRRQRPRDPDLRARRPRLGHRARRPGRHRARRRRRPPLDREDQGARAPRLLLRGRRRLVRAAAPARGRDLRAAVQARELPGRDREARRRRRSRPRRRSSSGSAIERYIRTAEGNGPVNALDRALRAAITEQHPGDRRGRADQLQGPDPRRAPRHRVGDPGAPRLLRRRRAPGARSASPRTSSRPPGRRSSTRSSTRSSRAGSGRGDAGRAAGVSERSGYRSPGRCSASARRSWSSRSCARGCSRSARCCRRFEARLRAAARRRRRGRRLERHRGAPPRRPRARLGRRRRGRDDAAELHRLVQLPAVRGRDARSSATSIRRR